MRSDNSDDDNNSRLCVDDGSPDSSVSYCFRKPIISSLAAVCAVATTVIVACTALLSTTTTRTAAHITEAVVQQQQQQPTTTSHRLLAELPTPKDRCPWVLDSFAARDGPDPNGTDTFLADKYALQSQDFNIFFRASAPIFWHDYVKGNWGDYTRELFQDLDPSLSDKSTWTWVRTYMCVCVRVYFGRLGLEYVFVLVYMAHTHTTLSQQQQQQVTGDQHMSNFGAWRNRHKDIVFGVNDFDEAAIFDFHVDVLRIAVSICNHALANGFESDAPKLIEAFTKSYVDTVNGYVGNEDALLFELTADTAHGKLRKELVEVEEKNSVSKQLNKFTRVGNNSGKRSFIKTGIGKAPHADTKLVRVSRDVEAKIRAAFTSKNYGATMMKLGWNVRTWDDDFFRVLDVAQRVGSGVGSFGVDRYYVLLNGSDDDDDEDDRSVILDVKQVPAGATEGVLDADDQAWYDTLFQNPADRAIQAQRELTSYTDPYTGWLTIDDVAFTVRQRSPWKDDAINPDKLDEEEFEECASQIAVATATSHVRGSPAKAPADFKNVMHSIMKTYANRKKWREGVENFARAYHEQVLLDHQCFENFVKDKYNR